MGAKRGARRITIGMGNSGKNPDWFIEQGHRWGYSLDAAPCQCIGSPLGGSGAWPLDFLRSILVQFSLDIGL